MDIGIEKIVVKTGDELIDIVRKISNSDAERFLITFVESSEILISSINLKVLLDSVDEKEGLLILQIPNNQTGVRNAKLAGITVIDSPTSPSGEVWEEAKVEYVKRQEKRSKSNKRLPQEYKSENITSFEERINSVLDKSREQREKSDNSTDVNQGLVIDQDIESNSSNEGKLSENLTKVDFKHVPDPTKKRGKRESVFLKIGAFFKKFKKEGSGSTMKKESFQGNTQKGVSSENKKSLTFKKKIIKILPKLLIPIVIVAFLVAFMYYRFAPYVRATIFIESKPIEVEKTFLGSENINEIDFENTQIPIKSESVTKSVSDVVDATGTAYRGEEATGSVTVSYINPSGCTDADEPVNLSEGHKVTTEGKSFLLTGSLSVTCNNYSVVGVEAADVGEEYNIPASKYFSIDGYETSKVYGVNSAEFSGGSKEEYTVLSKKDVDEEVKELTKIATDEAEGALTDIGNGWEIIDSTIESKVKDGSIKSAVAIGTETTSSDVSLEVVASATYYYTEGVEAGLNALLTEAAINQNLFESGEGLNLKLTGDIEKDLSVSEEDGKVEITLTASSSVEPSVDEGELVEDLKGMGWDEGVEYLNSLTFTSQDPTVTFTPESFPKKLRHFPSRQGRINISVKKIVAEEE